MARLKLNLGLPVYFIGFCIISSLLVISNGSLISSYLKMKSYYIFQMLDDQVGEKVQNSPYKDCGSVAHINSLGVSSCNKRREGSGTNDDICEISRGSNVTFNLSFIPKSNAAQLKAVIHGIVDYVPIPFPCPEPDACQNSGISCPIIAGKQYDYTLSASIKNSYPKMKFWVKGQLEDENGENVICIEIHVHIV